MARTALGRSGRESPEVTIAVALCIVVGLLTYVVPQVVDVFAQSKQELPFLTRALLWASEALKGKLGERAWSAAHASIDNLVRVA